MATMDERWLPPGFSTRRVDANGTSLSVAVGGDGPPMVLLHGWPQTGRVWRQVMGPPAHGHVSEIYRSVAVTGAACYVGEGLNTQPAVGDRRAATARAGPADPLISAVPR
ncbi:MAG: hypothetical protein ABW000_17275 [Actinoplanes sp.]